MMTDRKQRLIDVFEDTQLFYRQNTLLAKAVQAAKDATKLYEADDYPDIQHSGKFSCKIAVTKHKAFEAAMLIHAENPEWKIAVLNFASATNPGGGVKTGSNAQEESLCRCSTLYPTLTQDWMWQKYYGVNRAAHDNLHTDACIYSPGVVICRTDDVFPQRLEEKDWVTVDVISCAAPNLRQRPGNIHNPEFGKARTVNRDELYQLHLKRAKHILHVAAANGADALVLGAFGCGAFANDPEVVAKAYADAQKEYKHYFSLIEFAVYCRATETENYDAFRREMQEHSFRSGLQ